MKTTARILVLAVLAAALVSCASMDLSPAGLVSSGVAMSALEQIAHDTLPTGMDVEWTGLSREERLAGNLTLLIFALSGAFVFPVPAAQYESFSLPFVVMLAPSGAPAPKLNVRLCGG